MDHPDHAGWHGQAYSPARGPSASNVRRVALASSQACQWCIFPGLLIVCPSISCGSPNTASIVVRKQNQELQDQIASLTRAREADAATIRGLQERIGTVPTLSQERLEKLFTTHGIKLGRLTGGADLDLNKPGDEGIKVYVTPFDDDGEPLKAAGSFVIEAFDLAAKTPEIGKWTFDLDAARKAWNGAVLSHQYVLTCPWHK